MERARAERRVEGELKVVETLHLGVTYEQDN